MGPLLRGLLASALAALRALPAHALRLGRNDSKVVKFIRIQKTGGTTWGEVIMSELCPQGDQCDWFFHIDFDQATEQSTPTLVTMLRDPVERMLSEFFFIRRDEWGCPYQEQWDLQNDAFVNLVRDEPDADKALDSYLHAWPEHPSFNRQVLYLAGFKGVGAPLPFRWTGGRQQQEEFLSRAKRHLDEVHAFGFTDCFATSAGAMARALGMDENRAVGYANSCHDREQDKVKAASKLRRHRGKAVAERAEAVGSSGFREHWRNVIDEHTVSEIERLNWADMELHRFALEQFQKRFGEECVMGG